jgi:type II secretory pathway pseudopilin PulG
LIVIVGIVSSVALPNFLRHSAKANITAPLGKSSAALKQAQSIWVEKGTFTGVHCADVGITGTGGVENSWTYTCTGADDTFTVAVAGVAEGPNDNLGLAACSIDGPTGVITACTKDTDASS